MSPVDTRTRWFVTDAEEAAEREEDREAAVSRGEDEDPRGEDGTCWCDACCAGISTGHNLPPTEGQNGRGMIHA